VLAAVGTILIFSPGALLAVIPLGFLFVKLGQLYMVSGREMKRLESLAFSPILSQLGESLQVYVGICAPPPSKDCRSLGTRRWPAHIESPHCQGQAQQQLSTLSVTLDGRSSLPCHVSGIMPGPSH